MTSICQVFGLRLVLIAAKKRPNRDETRKSFIGVFLVINYSPKYMEHSWEKIIDMSEVDA